MQPKTFYERLDCSKFITKIPRNIPKELLHDWQYVGDKRAIDGAPLQIVMHFSPAKEAFYRGIPASRWGDLWDLFDGFQHFFYSPEGKLLEDHVRRRCSENVVIVDNI